LLAIVSEKTGYPAEMLGLDMELDADLGIDSIKRVEIFSAIQEKLPQAPVIKPEHLGSLRTLRHVVEFLANVPVAEASTTQSLVRLGSPPNPPPAASPVADAGLESLLLGIIAEKTGYPAEMLGLDMELDA